MGSPADTDLGKTIRRLQLWLTACATLLFLMCAVVLIYAIAYSRVSSKIQQLHSRLQNSDRENPDMFIRRAHLILYCKLVKDDGVIHSVPERILLQRPGVKETVNLGEYMKKNDIINPYPAVNYGQGAVVFFVKEHEAESHMHVVDGKVGAFNNMPLSDLLKKIERENQALHGIGVDPSTLIAETTAKSYHDPLFWKARKILGLDDFNGEIIIRKLESVYINVLVLVVFWAAAGFSAWIFYRHRKQLSTIPQSAITLLVLYALVAGILFFNHGMFTHAMTSQPLVAYILSMLYSVAVTAFPLFILFLERSIKTRQIKAPFKACVMLFPLLHLALTFVYVLFAPCLAE